MPKYLFTSDQRISQLPERIKWVAQFILDGHSISDISDKSDNNNAATLKFYYNLHNGTETCTIAANDPQFAIRNFVKKFQFPNTRTAESFNNSISEKTLIAPLRTIVKLLYNMANNDVIGTSNISLHEILYFIFGNPTVYNNPFFDCETVVNELLEERAQNAEFVSEIADRIEWKQYERQVREMVNVLPYASTCFKLSNGILSFSNYLSDKDFIDEVVSYNKIWYPSNIYDYNLSNLEYISYMDTQNIPYSVIDLNTGIKKQVCNNVSKKHVSSCFRPYITAIKSKPFLLLAGISGTGKSRIVRELARACWDGDDAEFLSQKPRNFEMIQVKPNWHDSSELIGYVSRVSGTPMFVAGDFLKFIARAWEEPDVPYFLCLDEMNLAPVEQYFAEYLSVIESRKADADGNITTDPILKKSAEDWFRNLTNELTVSDGVRSRFLNEGISIPQNLIVVGTVNMDETTFSFSRKVLDRAMTIEMNEVDLHGGLSCKNEQIGKLGKDELVGTAVEGVDIYESNKEVCDKALDYLQKINDRLEGTPFKIAYRTRNEVLLYVVNNLPYKKETETQDFVVARALDEITNMKILSRIEGDETKVSTEFLNALESAVKSGLEEVCGSLFAGDAPYNAISLAKLGEMKKRLASGYTSFWN